MYLIFIGYQEFFISLAESDWGLHLFYVQSNQKMLDLYATMHIFQLALPDAF